MGYEVRRVPPNWEHPKDSETDEYLPLYDQDYESKLAEWRHNQGLWNQGKHPYQSEEWCDPNRPFADYCEESPDPSSYRRAWLPGEATAYQIYETVTEGTPVSTVFLTEADLCAWLIDDEWTAEEAIDIIKRGYL